MPRKRLNSQARNLVANLLKYFTAEKENNGRLILLNAIQERVADALNISLRTICSIKISSEKNEQLSSSGKVRPRPKLKTLYLDDSSKMEIRNLVYSLYMQKQIPIDEPQVINLLTSHESFLPTLTEEQIVLDPISLLQQLQMSGMILSNENDTTPLTVDDITLLNIGEAKDNIQILTLPSIDTQNSSSSNAASRKVEKIRNLECDICHKFYASKDVLRKHKKTVHSDKNLKFPCIKCDKKFRSPDDLNKHIKSHSGYRPFHCMYCANSFMEEHNLKTHLKRIHQHENLPVKSSSTLVSMKYPLLSPNIEDPLFSNLFGIKKI